MTLCKPVSYNMLLTSFPPSPTPFLSLPVHTLPPLGLLAFLHHHEPTSGSAFDDYLAASSPSLPSLKPSLKHMQAQHHPHMSESLSLPASFHAEALSRPPDLSSSLLAWPSGPGSASLLLAGAMLDSVTQSVQAALAPASTLAAATAGAGGASASHLSHPAGHPRAQAGEGSQPSQHQQRRGLNWQLFWRQLERDHAGPRLIWNERTRQEVREALLGEVNLLGAEQQRVEMVGDATEGAKEGKEGECYRLTTLMTKASSQKGEIMPFPAQ